jgi:hypothetical protein
MIISGSESAITLIMKASTVPSAAPLASNACTMGMMPAALVYIGTPISTAAARDHQRVLAHEAGHEVLRHIAMNARANGDAGQDVGPDLAHDFRTLAKPASMRSASVRPPSPAKAATLGMSRTQSSRSRFHLHAANVQPATIATLSPRPR